MNNPDLPIWFTVQGLRDMDDVAVYILGLQRDRLTLQQENEIMRRRIREYEATQPGPAPGKG